MSGVQRSFLPLPMQRMRVNRAGPSRSEILSYRAFTVTIGGNSHPNKLPKVPGSQWAYYQRALEGSAFTDVGRWLV